MADGHRRKKVSADDLGPLRSAHYWKVATRVENGPVGLYRTDADDRGWEAGERRRGLWRACAVVCLLRVGIWSVAAGTAGACSAVRQSVRHICAATLPTSRDDCSNLRQGLGRRMNGSGMQVRLVKIQENFLR